MYIDLDAYDAEPIKNGYVFLPEASRYRCLICGAEFERGEIHQIGERFFEAEKAVQVHLEHGHGDLLERLLTMDKKYMTLTEHQKDLLRFLSFGLSDSEIAVKTGVTASTVRHQRFVLREKAKQAKLFLAVYELATGKSKAGPDALTPLHTGASMVDERYETTREESEKIIQNAFASLNPLKLKSFSAKEKKKIVILRKIAQAFEPGKRYPETQINRILKEIYDDFATLRRCLIQYGFMERTKDCSEYWLKP
jgi:DNA-binding CsgD family transcriptional regulator